MRAFLCAAALVAVASARVVMEPEATLHQESAQWRRGEAASATSQMTVRIMMKHEESDVRRLHDILMDVSDPHSALYGRHLSQDELAQVVPISDSKFEAVTSYLSTAKHGVELDVNPHRDIIAATMRVSDIEALFTTKVHTYHHKTRENVQILRASEQYTLPAYVAVAVSVVGDLVTLPRLRDTTHGNASASAVGGAGTWDNACPDLSGCKGLITPKVLQTRYKVDDTGMDKGLGNSMAVAEFQMQYFKQTDLDKFSSACKTNVTVDTIIGGDKQSAGVESELDIEYIRGVSPDIPLTVVYSNEYSLLDWMTQVSKMDNPPLVHSVSYGNDEKQQTSTAYMYSCNTQFMKAGARGISVLFASGDQGVCGREGCGFFKKRFKPDFPGGSPYITAVGGTDFVSDSIGDETAWQDSGGGFSDTFGIPSWQADAVKAYKANPDANLPDQSMWNNTGRGYPDIAALGGQKTPYCVVSNGVAQGVAGTSASSPVAASVFARLNGLRLKNKKSPLGFLNPFIYQNGDKFNDVTSGKNTGGGFNGKGFTAVKGWDPATGWGTPDYSQLSGAVMALP